MSTDEADQEDVEEAMEWVDETDLETPHANQPDTVFEHSRITNPGEKDRIMQTPRDAEGEEFLTMWISANADSAIDLDEVR